MDNPCDSDRDIDGHTNAEKSPCEDEILILTPEDVSCDGNKDTGPIKIFLIDVTRLSPIRRFFLLATMIFVLYLIYGYIGELIFRLEGFKPYGWYMTLVQFALTGVFGYTEQMIMSTEKRKIPLKTHALIAFLTVSTMGLSNSSMGYLNYPTHIIFKSCKLIPVLIGGILIQGEQYPVHDWLACVLMSIGLVFFTLADNAVQPSFNIYGVILVVLSICADAVIGNVQEKSMSQYAANNTEVIVFSFGIGFFYILAGQIITGQIIHAFRFCQSYPMETYGYIFIFSVMGYLGLKVILTMIQTSGVLVTVMVTNLRKAVTMLLSFIIFTKPFTVQYIWSGMIIMAGIYLHVRGKKSSKSNS